MRYQIVDEVRDKKPLIHCITNYVTANDVANMILAAGASPVMAESPKEAEEITAMSQGLVLNIGMLSDQKLEAMILAGKKAALLGHPVVLDPVGAGASSFRAEAVKTLLTQVPCAVVRGNRSEICRVAGLFGIIMEEPWREKGVDTAPGEEDRQTRQGIWEDGRLLTDLSRRLEAVVVMTGETDFVADGERIYRIRNGHFIMSRITGAGCMLDGVIASYGAAWGTEGSRQEMAQAAALATAAHGLCGELAYRKVKERQEGTGSFRTYLLDYMSLLDGRQLMGGADIEIQTIISDRVRSD